MAAKSASILRALSHGWPIPAGLALAFAVVTALALIWLGVSSTEFRDLVAYLLVSSAISCVVGYLAYRWAESGRRSIRMKILLAYGFGVVIVTVNIFVTARLMFLSSHDLSLLVVLIAFGSVLSISFGAAVARRMTQAVNQLAAGARRVSGGDLATRVDVSTNDELAELAHSFNVMVENVHRSEAMRRRAEEARRELVAAVSHDLRTPLTAAQAMIEALCDGVVNGPATVQRYLESIRYQMGHLSRLIDDLFELSHLDAAQLPFQLQPTDLSALVRETMEGMAMSARSRGTELAVETGGALVCNLEPTRIARALGNLVENALRHAPEGSMVLVSVVDQDGEALVSVEDEGPGIAEEDLERIFDRFYRGEKSRSRDLGGSGLGLAIARGIVEAHGGRIWAENRPGCGARFTFTLPLARR